MNLIIVESPTKARTFNRILKKQKGDSYYVFATLGHIRDLPKDSLGVDYKNQFKPFYKLIKGKEKIVKALKSLAKKNQQIILATDPDREGESIAYHVAYLLGFIKEKWPNFTIEDIKGRLKRIVFHEITTSALKKALDNPGSLRDNLVKAQQVRRLLDRVVGYEISPLLWKKFGKNWLSAGRVQTVALRLVVEREKEIRKFSSEKYFQVYGEFDNGEKLRGKLVEVKGKGVEKTKTISLFSGDYTYKKTILTEENIERIVKEIEKDSYQVKEVKEEKLIRNPPPPFSTSLLQQEAANRFRYSAKMTMKLAQDLYETGLITYHRTDSFHLAAKFVFAAKDYIEKKFGKEFALDKPRSYKSRSKLTQEAHEAIRPTDAFKTVDKIVSNKKITKKHKALYRLIHQRALATQMKAAEIRETRVFIAGKGGFLFEVNWKTVLFPGFLRVLNPGFVKNNSSFLEIKKGAKLKLNRLEVEDKFTRPPFRYSEASLIRALEQRGIGRPSTYAPIVSLIRDKGYVDKEGGYFYPTKLGEVISDYLAEAFPKIFSLDFTVEMEDRLDKVAQGKRDLIKVLSGFYKPFGKELEKQKASKEVINIEEETEEKCNKCGSKLVVRYSKYGKFLACSNYPDCKFTKPLLRFVKGKVCPKCKGRIIIRYSKSGKRFFGCANYPKCKFSAWRFNDIPNNKSS